eukprot:jgi/Chrzof1/876/Cz01g32110.t1
MQAVNRIPRPTISHTRRTPGASQRVRRIAADGRNSVQSVDTASRTSSKSNTLDNESLRTALEELYKQQTAHDSEKAADLFGISPGLNIPSADASAPPTAEGILRPALPGSLRLRATVLLASVQELEAKLEADLLTLAATLSCVVGVILFEFGIQGVLDHLLGDSVSGSISCILAGLGIVFGIKVSGYKVARLWQI